MLTISTPVLITSAVSLALVGILIWMLVRTWRRIHNSPRMVLRRIARARISDVLLPDGMDGEIHVEHLLLTEAGILVLEFRNASGALFGGDRMDDWSVIDGKRRFTFRNPLPALETRIQSVQALTGDVPVTGRVAVVGEVKFAGGRPDGVLRLADLDAEFSLPRGQQGSKGIPEALADTWERLQSVARPA